MWGVWGVWVEKDLKWVAGDVTVEVQSATPPSSAGVGSSVNPLLLLPPLLLLGCACWCSPNQAQVYGVYLGSSSS